MTFANGTTTLLLGILCISFVLCKKYEPNWKSLDSRPLPSWYDESKIGIFIHWGVFSVPAFGTEWFWQRWKMAKAPAFVDFMKRNYRPDFTYADFAPMFTTEFYNPDQWADIFNASGARYVVLVSKHCEGFTNWPSKASWNWNAMDVGPKRDLVGELAASIRKRTKIHFGVYHALLEWFHPLYLRDKANNFTTQDFVRTKTLPELYELITQYKPDLLWSDACWEQTDAYWNSTHFLAWLYNESPVKDTIITNDRWGQNCKCKHGGYWTCTDQYDPGVLQPHKWENAMTLDKFSWGYRRNARLSDYLTMDELLLKLARTISCGGNLLLNIGPASDGIISPIFEERLRQLGQWLGVNGEAIYGSKPWSYQNDKTAANVWYTMQKSTKAVYAIVLGWPKGNMLMLGAPAYSAETVVTLLGYQGDIPSEAGSEGGIIVNIPPIPADRMPCQWAWVFKFVGLKNLWI